MNIGKKLKQLRLSKGVQTKELEDLLSVEQPTYSKYENGHLSPPPEKLILLAKFYNISLDELLNNPGVNAENCPNSVVGNNYNITNIVNDKDVIHAITDLTQAIKDLVQTLIKH